MPAVSDGVDVNGPRLRYSVAVSLDGFIADEDGGYAWIPVDDAIDFNAFLSKIDTLLMGRATYEVLLGQEGGDDLFSDKRIVVVSTTLSPEDHPAVSVIGGNVERAVADLKAMAGKDIWLFGGGVLFRSMLQAGLVDRVEIAVIPVLLGQGTPVVPGLDKLAKLELHSSEHFTSGIVLLKYDVLNEDA